MECQWKLNHPSTDPIPCKLFIVQFLRKRNKLHIKDKNKNGKIVVNNPTYFPLPANNSTFWKFLINPIFAFSLLSMDSLENDLLYQVTSHILLLYNNPTYFPLLANNPTFWTFFNNPNFVFILLPMNLSKS